MVGGLGCAPTAPLDVGLAGHGEELGAHFGHRLSQMHPYVWAEGGVLWLLACRWPTGAEIGVGLAGDGRAEAHALAEARGAWAQEALGVSLVPAPAQAAEIRVEVTDAVAAADGSAGAGRTTADCALAPGDPPAARLVRASVQVAREAPPEDVADGEARDPRVLSDAERIGVFVHELGHALGFQGHAVTGTVMVRGRRGARETGARVQRGRPLEDSTLSALYALPVGAVLARAEIPPIRTADLDRLGALARARRWAGPTLRVGDRSARIFWVDGAGGEVGFVLVNLEETLRQPDRALFVAEEAARRLLDAAESEPTASGG
jgi:hypothetical protein